MTPPVADLDGDAMCEMKRLYVRPDARGLGVGRALVEALFSVALEQGYAVMRLDAAPELAAARGLYEALGFHEIPPYHTRHADPLCFERRLG